MTRAASCRTTRRSRPCLHGNTWVRIELETGREGRLNRKLVLVLVLMVSGIGFSAPASELPATEFDQMYADLAAYLLDPAHHPDLAHGVVQIEYGDAKGDFPAWVHVPGQPPGGAPL